MDRTTAGLPAAGEFYRHFKGNLYQVIGTAYDEATMVPVVVYQALYGEYRWYVRPAAEFLSPVDKEKYPDSTAEYRFERVNPADFADGGQGGAQAGSAGVREDAVLASAGEIQEGVRGGDALLRETAAYAAQDIEVREIQRESSRGGWSAGEPREALPGGDAALWSNPEEDQVRPELLLFLDAETPAQKLAVLREIRGKMDAELITNIELSIDLMPDEKETLERRLELVEMNLEKRVRYEGGRLR